MMLVLATANPHKVKEFRRLVEEFDIEVKSLADFGPIPQAVEDGDTFDENAYKKAYHTAKILGLPALADDSGLVVEALNGAPGVYSARYAGEQASDEDNVNKLLEEMSGLEKRRAYFQCVLSIAVPSGPALTYEGRCDGTITKERRGSGGFGYDPVFLCDTFQKTFAELSMDEKNKVSHRGLAMQELCGEMDKVIKWLKIRLEEEKPEKPDHNQFLDNDWSGQ